MNSEDVNKLQKERLSLNDRWYFTILMHINF